MNYIDELAMQIRSRIPPQELPDEDTVDLFRFYAALALAKGEDVDAADVHDVWSAWMSKSQPDHESIVPFDELPADVAVADGLFVRAIRDVVKGRRR